MVEIILVVLIVIMFASRMKWRVTTLSLLYYLEKKRYKLPSDENMKEFGNLFSRFRRNRMLPKQI